MSLFDWQDLLDDHQFFLVIDLVKHGISPGNVKLVDDNPIFQNKFFFITMTSREGIFFKPFQGSFYDPSCLFRQAIDLIR